MDRLENHISTQHASKFTEAQLPAVLKLGQQPLVQIPVAACPFCEGWELELRKTNPQVNDDTLFVPPVLFRRHVAYHMEQLALFAIPRGCEVEGSGQSTGVAANDGTNFYNMDASSLESNEIAHNLELPLHVAADESRKAEVMKILDERDNVSAKGATQGTALLAVASQPSKVISNDEFEAGLKHSESYSAVQFVETWISESKQRCKDAIDEAPIGRRKSASSNCVLDEPSGITATGSGMDDWHLSAYPKSQSRLNQDDTDTLTSMRNLASTYTNQGRWKEAEAQLVQVMETSKRVLGQEHTDTLTSMNSLALTYNNQGRWKEAEELEVQVMETFKRVLGQEHPDTLTSMANLASTYRNQGRWKEAEEVEVQVMETFKRVLGQEHPSTLTSMNNLASTYSNQRRWAEAEILQIEVVNRCRTTLGEDHPHTVRSHANLATLQKNREAIRRPSELNSFQYGLDEALNGLSVQSRDRQLQLAMARSLENGNTDEESLRLLSRILQNSGDDDDFGTDQEKLRLALAMSLDLDEDNDSNEERLQRALAMGLRADEDNDTGQDHETNEDNEIDEERLLRELAMSKEENDEEKVCCFKSKCSPEGAGTDKERLRHALAMSVQMDEECDTDEDRLQRALAMPLEEHDDNKTGEHNETNEDNETDEERLRRELAMSMEENEEQEICCFKRR
jgi:tetratricopeptide (TPR) repeat protein